MHGQQNVKMEAVVVELHQLKLITYNIELFI